MRGGGGRDEDEDELEVDVDSVVDDDGGMYVGVGFREFVFVVVAPTTAVAAIANVLLTECARDWEDVFDVLL